MLPVSHEVADTPIIRYDRGRPPFIPYCDDQRFVHIVPDITVMIVNESGLLSGRNPVRMFFYNLISQNHWTNPYFDEVFQYCLSHIAYSMQHSTASAESLVPQSVNSILTLYSSDLVFVYPELKSVISPQQFEACSQNSGLFQTFKTEISRMSYPGHHYQQPGVAYPGYAQAPMQMHGQIHYGGNPGMVMAPPGPNMGYGYPQPNQYQQQPVYPQHMYPQQQLNQHPGMMPGYGQQQQPRMMRMPVIHDNRPDPSARDYGAKPSEERYRHSAFQEVNDDMENLKQDRYFQMVEDDFRSPLTYEPEVIVGEDKQYDVVTTANNSGVSKMNRTQHELGVPTQVMTMAQKEIVSEVLNQEEYDVDVIPTIAVDLDIDVPVAQFRADSLQIQGKSIYRKYIYIPSALVSTTNVKSKLKEWLKGNTLVEIAMSLRSALTLLAGQSETSEEINSVLILLRELDDKLTVRVNEFLTRKIVPISKAFSIDSFMEDVPSLPNYVMRNAGINGKELLEQFDRELTNKLTNPIFDSCNVKMDEAEMVAPPTGVNIGYLPATYSVTLLQIDSMQLRLPRHHHEYTLNPEDDKLLYTIFKDLIERGDENPFEDVAVDYHLLVTADGARYQADVNSLTKKYTLQRI